MEVQTICKSIHYNHVLQGVDVAVINKRALARNQRIIGLKPIFVVDYNHDLKDVVELGK